MPKIDPVHPANDEARALARSLIDAARFGALAVRDQETGDPVVTRIALVPGPDGAPMTLVSDLSSHTPALLAHPRCSVLVGEPEAKGDPLTHPRLTLMAEAQETDKAAGKALYLAAYPKAKLYYDFTDFRLIRLVPIRAMLNGGFGKAFALSAADICPDIT